MPDTMPNAMPPEVARYLPARQWEKLQDPAPRRGHLLNALHRLNSVTYQLATYLPRHLVDALLQDPRPGRVQGQQQHGTLLFSDVSGFTALSERLAAQGQVGAEQLTTIMNDYFAAMLDILAWSAGSLLKFAGDALLVYFAAQPQAEQVRWAVRAAQRMMRAMHQFSAIETPFGALPLQMKIGLSTGDFVAASVGSAARMEYVLIGPTVTRALVAEGHASAGQIILDAATAAALPPAEVVPHADGFYRLQPQPDAPLDDFEIQATARRAQPTAAWLGADDKIYADIRQALRQIETLTPYIAAEVVEQTLALGQERALESEFRPTVTLFLNFTGFAACLERLGLEETTQLLDDYFNAMHIAIQRYGGIISRIDPYSRGSKLLALFGAPVAHEDDPYRAVYTALDMQKAVRENFSALQTPSGIYRFEQRIGINTGALFAGNAGAPNLRQEYTLMGDDINMAARLMSYSEWGQILVSKKTQERVAAFFEMEDKGEIQVKGKQIRIHTYAVMGHSGEIGRTRGLKANASPLIGRDAELQALQMQLQSLLQAQEGEPPLRGSGKIVTIIGDSGLGKSRFVREIKTWLKEQPGSEGLLHIEGQALSFSEYTSYWLAAQVIRGALQLPPDASENDVLFELWERGEALMGRENAREAVPFLAHLLGIELEGEWAEWVKDLEPQVRQKQAFWAAREFFTRIAQQRPTLILLDDLHWADEASLALLENLLSVTDQAPLLFCLIFRPQREKGCWHLRDRADSNFHHRYTEIWLRPISEEQSRQLLTNLLPGAEFTPRTQQEILDKSAGNPFYLEEVVRSLIESGAVAPVETRDEGFTSIADFARSLKRRDARLEERKPKKWQVTKKIEQIQVPDTLQGAITARIDRLTEDTRQALQMAAVIGRRFQAEILGSIVEAEAELGGWLAQLERSDLIKRTEQTSRDETYMFPDSLVQEVAYANLLMQRRQEFHRKVGEALEKTLGDRIEQECALLAHHFSQSDDKIRASKYLELAGQKAQRDFSNETAIQNYTLLLELWEEQYDPEEIWERRFDILKRRQQVYGLRGMQQERESDLNRMMQLAESHADDALRAETLTQLADLYQWTSRYDALEEAANAALKLQTARGDEVGQAAALQQLGVAAYVRGDYERARPLLERAVSLHQAQGDTQGEAWSAMYLGMIHLQTGNYGEAAQQHQHAYALAQGRQDMFQMGIHLTNAARVSLQLGDYEQALAQFRESLEMKTRVGDRVGQGFSLYGVGLAQLYLAQYAEAEISLQKSLELRHQIEDKRGLSYTLQGLGLVKLAQGQFEPAARHFREALELRRALQLQLEIISDLSFLAVAQAGQGQLEKALETAREALALLESHPHHSELPQLYLNHYRVLAANDDPMAETYLQQAADALQAQAQRISDPALRKQFLAQVRVGREIEASLKALTAG